VQWITLFDHPDDDIYDGLLEEDDEEVPRMKLEFLVEEVDHSRASDVSRTGVREKAGTAQSKASATNGRESTKTMTQKVGTAMQTRTTSGNGRTGSGRPGSGRGG